MEKKIKKNLELKNREIKREREREREKERERERERELKLIDTDSPHLKFGFMFEKLQFSIYQF